MFLFTHLSLLFRWLCIRQWSWGYFQSPPPSWCHTPLSISSGHRVHAHGSAHPGGPKGRRHHQVGTNRRVFENNIFTCLSGCPSLSDMYPLMLIWWQFNVLFSCLNTHPGQTFWVGPNPQHVCVLRETKLLFFNRREEDILWRCELDELAANSERYCSCVCFALTGCSCKPFSETVYGNTHNSHNFWDISKVCS